MSCGCWLFQTTHITERKSNRSLQHTPLCDTHHCRPCRLQVHHPMSSIHILHAVIAHGDAPWPLSPQTSEIYFFARAQAWTGCHWATGFSRMSHKTQGHKRPETVRNCSLLMRSGMIWLNYSTSLLTDRQDHTVIHTGTPRPRIPRCIEHTSGTYPEPFNTLHEKNPFLLYRKWQGVWGNCWIVYT